MVCETGDDNRSGVEADRSQANGAYALILRTPHFRLVLDPTQPGGHALGGLLTAPRTAEPIGEQTDTARLAPLDLELAHGSSLSSTAAPAHAP